MRPFPLVHKKLMFMFMIMLMILMLVVGTKLKALPILTCRLTLSMMHPFVILNTENTGDSVGGRPLAESVASAFEFDILPLAIDQSSPEIQAANNENFVLNLSFLSYSVPYNLIEVLY